MAHAGGGVGLNPFEPDPINGGNQDENEQRDPVRQQLGGRERQFEELKKKVPPKENNSGCSWQKVGTWIAIAVIVLGLIVGTGGILTYIGQLHVGLASVGMMSQGTGLYFMLAGLGAAFISTVLLTVGCLLSRAKEAKAQNQSKSIFFCFDWCRSKTPDPVH